MFKNLVNRFLKYVKFDTRSNPKSTTVPSTKSQVEFAQLLMDDLYAIGLNMVNYDKESGFLTACLPANTKKEIPTIGFIAHMDTADYNSKNIDPRIIYNYDGESKIILNQSRNIVLDPEEFPNLRNYKGQDLITTNGNTLLGADDKAGIAEIITAVEFFINNPEIEHGDIKLAFGPDEEIGTGANNFDVKRFKADFAYTVDAGPLGELQYETFNAATALVKVKGKSVHTGTAKNKLINSITLAMKFHNSLPKKDVPEKTENYQGFYHLDSFQGNVEESILEYLIRDHKRDKFEARKKALVYLKDRFNKELGKEYLSLEIKDTYYNMKDVIKDHMHIIDLAERAMLRLDIQPIIEPIRGGTDGARLSFMGLPTPNIFAGGENLHGPYEFVSIQTMEKATQLIIEICKLNANPM